MEPYLNMFFLYVTHIVFLRDFHYKGLLERGLSFIRTIYVLNTKFN